jgi:propanol-preferring alcohol dehydrogenase
MPHEWRMAAEADSAVYPRPRGDRIVSAVGAGVTIVKEGDRVGVPWLHSACGHCEYCLKGWETVCPEAQFSGYTKLTAASPATSSPTRTTSHIFQRASRRSRRHRSSVPASRPTRASSRPKRGPVSGLPSLACGGLGHLAVQYAKAMGLLVAAIDIDDKKLAHAKALGR